MNLFAQAVRQKLRFETPKGSITVEDLWDLPLTNNGGVNLDNIARDLFRKIKDADTESFVVKTPKVDATLQLKFDVVKHIIDVRLAEAESAKQAREIREKKQQLLAIISQKENEQLMGAPLEELRAMLEKM